MFATAGREPELPALPAPALVAIAVGKTKDGESLPANPKGVLLAACWTTFSQFHYAAACTPTKLGVTGTARGGGLVSTCRSIHGGASDSLVHDNGRGLVGHGGDMKAGPIFKIESAESMGEGDYEVNRGGAQADKAGRIC